MTVKKSFNYTQRFGWLCHQTFKRVKRVSEDNTQKRREKTVTFEISIEDLKFYNSDIEFVAEPGQFDVYIGASSDAD
jgi:beta-glucosidase